MIESLKNEQKTSLNKTDSDFSQFWHVNWQPDILNSELRRGLSWVIQLT